ncbi:MAG: tetratricopeptide repeat protein [Planctomycetes bacterium]|nr:tetratricopeptide repeat protein [Planctomycetota bacterium]
MLTPEAPEFAEALFLLGEVLERRGEFERAIATLEEALDRYPDDPRVWPANYLLAESYRRSALSLKEETAGATFAAQVQQIRAEAARRFGRARELYRASVAEYEVRGVDSLTRLETLYYRHAMLHEADCYFETGNYQQALKLYEDAAGALKDSPSCLAVYVQIINSHVFLGQVDEARAALARARILVDAIPAEAFAKSVSPETREDWKRYFGWLGESELF